MQGLAHELDQDARCSEMLRASSVKRPAMSSKYDNVPLELIHYSKIVTEDPSSKHFLCVVMLCRNDRPTFHIVHISTGNELRENLDVFLGNIGQIKLITQSKALEIIDLEGELMEGCRFQF